MHSNVCISECTFKGVFGSHFGDVENQERLNDLPKVLTKPAGRPLAAPVPRGGQTLLLVFHDHRYTRYMG